MDSSHPTCCGKELILKALIMSRSWFLEAVNGMPDHIENEMTKIMKDFIWDGNKRGLMRVNYTAKVREKGGLGMPDLKTRMKAIDIMWLKKYLDAPGKRPTWCWVADSLIQGDTYSTLDSKSGGISKAKVGSPDMENQTGKALKTHRLYKEDAKGSQKIQY